MPDRATTIIAALIVDRPLCARCLLTTAGCSASAAKAALVAIGRALVLHEAKSQRCHACGDVGVVVFADRAPRTGIA